MTFDLACLASLCLALTGNPLEEALRKAESAVKANPKSADALARRAAVLERLDRYDDAVADYTRILALDKTAATAYQLRGLVQFKAGNIEASIADFDEYIARKPDAKISHWQRGISYYYARRYDDGRRQFEGYQDYDSNDVENAVWRFMCMARKDGLEKARKDMLKIGDDRRIPMRQVYDLYKGDLKPGDVLAAARAGDPPPDRLNRQLFYAHLYLGIYFDLLEKKSEALEHLNLAADKHRIGHYMWDVARIHRDLLARERANRKKK